MSSFTSVTSTRSPCRTWSVGPGTRPSNVSAFTTLPELSRTSAWRAVIVFRKSGAPLGGPVKLVDRLRSSRRERPATLRRSRASRSPSRCSSPEAGCRTTTTRASRLRRGARGRAGSSRPRGRRDTPHDASPSGSRSRLPGARAEKSAGPAAARLRCSRRAPRRSGVSGWKSEARYWMCPRPRPSSHWPPP